MFFSSIQSVGSLIHEFSRVRLSNIYQSRPRFLGLVVATCCKYRRGESVINETYQLGNYNSVVEA